MHDKYEMQPEPQTLTEARELIDALRVKIEHLEIAVKSRDRIGQAKGLLMERLKLSEDEAFRRLVEVSQVTHTKLAEVADQLMFCGELPILPKPR